MAEAGQDLFPAPPQPHFIRAQQKDELYLQHLTDACHDAVRRVLGPHGALRWAGETRAAAQLLYYALTTGAGLQTLGEEYCDIVQVAGAPGRSVPAGTLRRGLLVLLQAAGPYLADHLAAGQEEDDEGGFAAWQQAQAAARAAAAAAAAGDAQQQQQQRAGQAQSPGAALLARLAAAAQQLRDAARRAAAPAARQLPAAAAFLRDHAATLVRIHLALFYIFGAYYQPSKRATGVRYLFLGRALEGRPSYHVLGLLLCTQLGVSGLMWLAQRYRSSTSLILGSGTGGDAQQAAAARQRHAVLLSADGKPLPDSGWGASSEATAAGSMASPGSGRELAGSRKCPLCLSSRAHPTATPCGHVFCWQCIAEWGNQKPECPLCRAEFSPSSLVCVRHADF